MMKYRIIDLSILPDKYKRKDGFPNVAAITQAVISGLRKIPGVEMYESEK